MYTCCLKHDGPSGQHPAGNTPPAKAGEGRVRTIGETDEKVSHVESELNVSDKTGIDETIGQNQENRGLGK